MKGICTIIANYQYWCLRSSLKSSLLPAFFISDFKYIDLNNKYCYLVVIFVNKEEKYCYIKIHKRGKEKIIAICDEELLGKILKDEKLQIEVKAEFYGGEKVPLSEIYKYISDATVINLLGNSVVAELAKNNSLIMDAAIRIGGVLHVQLIR